MLAVVTVDDVRQIRRQAFTQKIKLWAARSRKTVFLRSFLNVLLKITVLAPAPDQCLRLRTKTFAAAFGHVLDLFNVRQQAFNMA